MDVNTAVGATSDPQGALNPNQALNAARSKYQGDLNAEDKAMAPIIAKAKEANSQPLPTPPEPKTAGPAPKSEDFNSQAWIGAISAFSALIGARGRGRGTAALKAYAAGLNGLKAGNQQAFENASKTWKENTDAMMKENEQQMEKYKAILENRKLTSQEAFDELKMQGYADQNKLLMDAKDFDQAAKVVDMIKSESIKLNLANAKVEAKTKQIQAQQEKAKADSAARYEEWKQTPRAAKMADALAKGLPPSYYIRGRGKDGEEQLQFAQDLAVERHPGLDLAEASEDYKAQSAALRSFGNGKQADTVRSFNVAYSHIDLLTELATALQNGNVQAINAGKQRFEQEFGSAAPTNFDAVKSILSDEVNKAAVGGAGALGDREEIRKSILNSSSPEQINGAANVYKRLIVGQMAGIQQQYEQSTGRKDFNRFLLPEVEQDLKKHTTSPAPKSAIPAGAPTATGPKGEKMYWNGSEWVNG